MTDDERAEPMNDLAKAKQLCLDLLGRAEHLASDVAWAEAADLDVGDRTTATVQAIIDRIDAASAMFAAARAERQAGQLSAIGQDAARLQLHIGAGSAQLPGWINLDVAGADVDVDLRRPLPFADGSVSHIFGSHMLEHLRHADEAQRFLLECRRVLAPGGKIRIVVPDIAPYLEAHHDGDEEFWEAHAQTWTWWDYDGTTSLDRILHYAGVSTPATDLFGHRYGYDAESLESLLSATGLGPVTRSTFQGSTDPVFCVDDASLVAHATYRGRSLSLFVEGMKLF